jgi:UDP-N-acetylmuramyl pentapeptide phosphotransferase/UDP-N-acetylglucosamine-1-phosphate transferase
MGTNSIEYGFLSIFALLTFFIFLFINKYSYKLNKGILLDKDFTKPQAFHKTAVSRSGGIASVIALVLFYYIYYLLYTEILYEYIFICTSLFIIGYLDDARFKISPIIRLSLMIIFLIIFINFLSIQVDNIDLVFFIPLFENKIFSMLFTLLCFLFIVNGANLIDGFNGLLAINLIIINFVLLFINLNNNQFEFSIFLMAQIIILISFLFFNFPNAKIFFGDGGSYLFGSSIALNAIFTNNLNPNISSFFFCILVFYLFFEVFFSFIRKIYQKKSPVLPDNKHLHMLSYKKISMKLGPKKSNYINSIVINLVYSILVLPSIYFADNSLICKYWFFSLILIYTLIYFRLYSLTKN